MSDNEAEPLTGEPVPEAEPEEPRNFLKQEQINEALSLITRTAGKIKKSNLNAFRWTFIRLQHSQS